MLCSLPEIRRARPSRLSKRSRSILALEWAEMTGFSRRTVLSSLGQASIVLSIDSLIGGANTDWFTAPIKDSTPFTPQLVDIGAAAGLKDRCESGGDRVKKWIIETTG